MRVSKKVVKKNNLRYTILLIRLKKHDRIFLSPFHFVQRIIKEFLLQNEAQTLYIENDMCDLIATVTVIVTSVVSGAT